MYAIIDLETSGFNHLKNALCEIAVIIADKDKNEIDRFNCFIKPFYAKEEGEWIYEDEAFAVNGLTFEFLEQN